MKTLEEYLKQLGAALKDRDKATRRDALADAEDHLRSALREAREAFPGRDEESLIRGLIEDYGTPEETAAAYRDMDRRLRRGGADGDGSLSNRFLTFLSVIGDGRAWRSLLYGLLAFPVGVFYFSWTVTGLALSLSLMILIIGIPVAVLFFLSFHGLAFIEGRLVETLLGEPMPRRKIFIDSTPGWASRLKRLFLKADSWLIILYLILLLPLGTLYFCLYVAFLVLGIGLVSSPLVMSILNEPFIVTSQWELWHNFWTSSACLILGTLIFLGTLHMARGLGWVQGKMAKAMLVRD